MTTARDKVFAARVIAIVGPAHFLTDRSVELADILPFEVFRKSVFVLVCRDSFRHKYLFSIADREHSESYRKSVVLNSA